MASNLNEIADALRLEEIEFNEFAQRTTAKADAEIKAMEADMARGG